MHIATAASKLSAVLDSLPPTKETQPQTLESLDPVIQGLLQQELETFVDCKSKLCTRTSSDANPGMFCLPQKKLRPDNALLDTLTAMIKAGMERCETNLHGSAAPLSSEAMATDSRLEQLVAHHETFVAGLRKLSLNRKACYAELNALARLHPARAGSLSQSNNSNNSQHIKNAAEDESSVTAYWAARDKELQAQLLATERLHRNISSQEKLVEGYADSIMLEVLPPVIR